WYDRLDGYDEVAAFVGAFERCLDALLEIREQIARVSAENFIAPLAAENYFKVLCRKLRHHKLWERARPRHWKIEVINYIGNVVAEVTCSDVDRIQPRAYPIDSCLGKIALVIAAELGKAAMEAFGHTALSLAGQDRD